MCEYVNILITRNCMGCLIFNVLLAQNALTPSVSIVTKRCMRRGITILHASYLNIQIVRVQSRENRRRPSIYFIWFGPDPVCSAPVFLSQRRNCTEPLSKIFSGSPEFALCGFIIIGTWIFTQRHATHVPVMHTHTSAQRSPNYGFSHVS